MRVADISTLYDYHFWANARILDTAALLTAAQFTAPTRVPHGSVRGTLVHLLWSERFWPDVWRGRPRRPDLAENAYPDVATLRKQWRPDEAALRGYLGTLADTDLDRPLAYTFLRSGRVVTAPLWYFLLHLVNHGTQHRGEVAQMLTECGQSPGDIDMLLNLPTTPVSE